MSRVRLFYLFIALALLVTGSITILSAINTIDVTSQLRALANGTPEKTAIVQGKTPQTSFFGETIAPPILLIGLAIVAVIGFAIGWIVASKSKNKPAASSGAEK